jgi:hypothetical protein
MERKDIATRMSDCIKTKYMETIQESSAHNFKENMQKWFHTISFSKS